MADELGRLTLIIEAQMKDLVTKISGLEDSVKKFSTSTETSTQKAGSSWGAMAKGFIVGQFSIDAIKTAYAAMINLFKESLQEYDNEVVAVSRLSASYGEQSAMIIELADARSKMTRDSKDEIIAAANSAAMHKLNAEQFAKLLPVIQDYAAKTGKGLLPTTEAFTRAIQFGTTRGLRPYGIELDATRSQQEIFNQLVSIGDGNVKGFAEKVGQLGSGPLIIIKNQIDELKDGIGRDLQPAMYVWAKTLENVIYPILAKGAELMSRFVKQMVGMYALIKGDWDLPERFEKKFTSPTEGTGAGLVGPPAPSANQLGTTSLGSGQKEDPAIEKRALASAKLRTQLEKDNNAVKIAVDEVTIAYDEGTIGLNSYYQSKVALIQEGYTVQKKFIDDQIKLATKESEKEKLRGDAARAEMDNTRDLLDLKKEYHDELMKMVNAESETLVEASRRGIEAIQAEIDARKEAYEQFKSQVSSAVQLGQEMGNAIADGLSSGAKGFKEVLKGMLIAFVSFLEKILIGSIVENAMKKFGSGLGVAGLAIAAAEAAVVTAIFESAKAGMQQFGEGGLIGGRPHSQGGTVIEAEKNEYIQRAAAVDYYGVGVMEAMNRRMIPKDILSNFNLARGVTTGAGSHAAEGGLVTGAAGRGVTIVNTVDPGLMDQYLSSADGQRAIINVIGARRFEVARVLA
jgi:hypothetical protein